MYKLIFLLLLLLLSLSLSLSRRPAIIVCDLVFVSLTYSFRVTFFPSFHPQTFGINSYHFIPEIEQQ